jgi:signal transduction histidine kinase
MGSVSRRARGADPPQFEGQSFAPVKALPTTAVVAAAAADLTHDLLARSEVTPAMAREALERLRTRTQAIQALFWSISGTRATCLAYAGADIADGGPAPVTLSDGASVVHQLRQQRTLLRRTADTSGVKQLLPRSVESVAVLAAPAEGVTGVLILGWDAPYPPCDRSAAAQLQTAAAVLLRTIAAAEDPRSVLAEAILGSLSSAIIVISRDGAIVSANAAWTASPLASEFAGFGPGANFFQIGRRAVVRDGGFRQFGPVLDRIEAVARGDSQGFHGALTVPVLGEEEQMLVSATPLRHPDGGVVVAYTNAAREADFEPPAADQQFFRVIDAVPLPIWIHGDDSKVIYGNALWRKIAEAAARDSAWTDVFHPHDRERAVEAFQSNPPRVRAGTLEARVRCDDGSYRWSICTVVPYGGPDGDLAWSVGFCCDIGVQRHTEWALTELSAKLAAAREEERNRIGRELHDDVGQQAALLAAKIEALRDRRKMTEASLRAGIEEARDRVQDLAVSIHNLSHELHSPKLKLLGLVKTLSALCRDVSRQSGVKVTFDSPGKIRLPDRISLCLFRVAQEALQNAVKHSGTQAIEVALTQADSTLTLQVADKGRGFDLMAAPTSGLGLLSMRERIELNGGTLLIDTSAADGTKILATLPLLARNGGDGMR